jgi:hypothetical protein
MVKDLESKTFNVSTLLLSALIGIIADMSSTQVIIKYPRSNVRSFDYCAMMSSDPESLGNLIFPRSIKN